jgi:hypothetical protein
MKTLKNILFFILISFLLGCKKGEEQKLPSYNEKSIEEQKNNFDNILKEGDYSWNDGYFITADYGIVYNPKGNNPFGNIILYLIPKNKFDIKDEEIEEKNQMINSLSIENIKKEFNIYLFLIDKKYLQYLPNGDSSYEAKENYTENLYTYENQKWILLDSLNVKNQNEQEWRENFINRQIKIHSDNQNIVTNIKKFIQEIENKDFSIAEKQNCDLNKDNLEDIILVFKNNKEYKSDDDQTKIAPIIILINNGKQSYLNFENRNIYPNDFNDFYSKLTIKDNFFTVELFNEVPNEYTVEKYISFKYDNQSIILDKYSEIINYSENKIDKKNYSQREFGIINFQDFNSNTIEDKLK